jgi:hypothetical protein
VRYIHGDIIAAQGMSSKKKQIFFIVLKREGNDQTHNSNNFVLDEANHLRFPIVHTSSSVETYET